MMRFFGGIAAALASLTGLPAASADAQPSNGPSAELAQLLDLLERGAILLLEKGEHVPVTAFVLTNAGKIELIDHDQGFPHQEDALTATLGQLIPLARAKEISASGIMFQPGDAGEEKPPVLIFDLEQVGQPRFIITLTYTRTAGGVAFGPKTYNAQPGRLFEL